MIAPLAMKLRSQGVDLSQAGRDLSTLLGGDYVNRFSVQGRSYKVIPQIRRADRLTAEQLEDIYVTGAGVKGRAAITSFWDDICSRAMTHLVETSIENGRQLAFSQACTYPDGMKVLCLAMCELKGGRIAKQTVVQAWDE